MKTKLDWDKFEPKFGTWAKKIKPFFDNGGFDPIFEFLKSEGRRGKKIAPVSDLVFRCFRETDINDCKVVLVGMCPYHSAYNHVLIADGLAMSCSITGKLQPSLEKFYEGIENEVYNGLALDRIKNPDLKYLAKQGVFLFNAALTTEFNKAGSHQEIWEPFTKYVISEALGYTGIPIIFLGKEAAKYERFVTPFTHTFVLDHPAYAARTHSEWETKGVFRKVSDIIWQNNRFKINWLDSIEDKFAE